MKLLIDWSVLCHIAWHKMASPNYEARTNIEQAEYARNLAGALIYFWDRFRPSETILALDGKEYWRREIYSKHYVDHVQVFRVTIKVPEGDKLVPKDLHFLCLDAKVYRLDFHEGMDKYLMTKLKKEEATAAMALEGLTLLPRDGIPYKILELFPTYKGDRKENKWDYTTTYPEFKSLSRKIAYNLAGTLGARVVLVEEAEADDIAYVYKTIHPKEEIIFLTTDSDWNQLLRGTATPWLHIHNPLKMEWVELTHEQSAINLAIKIISGDGSDGIPGLRLKESTTLIGPKNAEKMVLEYGVPGIYRYLEENVPEDLLKFNLKMIYLKNIPQRIKDAIMESLKSSVEYKKPLRKPEEYGLERADTISIKAAAEEARASDIEEGIYADD